MIISAYHYLHDYIHVFKHIHTCPSTNVARGNTLEPRGNHFSVNIHRSKILLTIKNTEKKESTFKLI